MTNVERAVEVIKKSLQLGIYGIKIEETKQTIGALGLPDSYKIYFSIPESSTMYDENKDKIFNEKIKTSDGLTEIAKKLIIELIICSDRDDMISSEDISDFVKFYVKIRKGEVWTKEQSEDAMKMADEQIKTAIEKLKALNGYKEV